jgi:hypothetical protein
MYTTTRTEKAYPEYSNACQGVKKVSISSIRYVCALESIQAPEKNQIIEKINNLLWPLSVIGLGDNLLNIFYLFLIVNNCLTSYSGNY